MPELLALSTPEIVSAGIATACLSSALLYFNAILQWRYVQLPKENQPQISDIRGNLREYTQLFKRWKAKTPTYVNDTTWLIQLQLPNDASPLKVITKVESLLDVSLKNGLQNTMQHAVLQQFLSRAKNKLNVKSARQRLLADQEATNEALSVGPAPGKKAKLTVSSDHPISKALRTAKPKEVPVTDMSTETALRVLGLSKLAARRKLTAVDVKSAYKSKKRGARKSVGRRSRLELAFRVASTQIA